MEARNNQPHQLVRRTIALVLAGGRGSRLKQLTDKRAWACSKSSKPSPLYRNRPGRVASDLPTPPRKICWKTSAKCACRSPTAAYRSR